MAAAKAERGRSDDFDAGFDLPAGGEGPGPGEPLPTDEELFQGSRGVRFRFARRRTGLKDELSTDDIGLDSIDSLMAEEPKSGGTAGDHERAEDEALKLEDFGESLDAEMKEPAGEFDDISFIEDTDITPAPAKRGVEVGRRRDRFRFDHA